MIFKTPIESEWFFSYIIYEQTTFRCDDDDGARFVLDQQAGWGFYGTSLLKQ